MRIYYKPSVIVGSVLAALVGIGAAPLAQAPDPADFPAILSATLAASHTRTELSSDPLTMLVPSGEKFTLNTLELGTRRTATSAALAASHTRNVVSREPLAIRVPSGE